MQPYFFPYIGYFQLIAAVDRFVIYDNIKYTKKGWINRNRYLLNGKESIFSIPLTKDSDSLDVRDRYISPQYQRIKLIRQIDSAYRGAPEFANIFPKICEIINYRSDNLFDYIYNSVKKLCDLLHIETELIISSEVLINHSLKKGNYSALFIKNDKKVLDRVLRVFSLFTCDHPTQAKITYHTH